MSIEINGREIYNPWARAIIIAGMVSVLVLLMTVGFVVLALSLPLLIVLHACLRACGRRGFAHYDPSDNTWYFEISARSFRKV
jgi:hypothetical protein